MSCELEKGPPTAQAGLQDLVMLRPHSPTVRAGPTPFTGWARLHGGQRSVSLEYQTCTSTYLFDTLVTGMPQTGGASAVASGSGQ